jgi:cation diffusion facilitator family transporter
VATADERAIARRGAAGIRAAVRGVVANALLAAAKIVSGVAGNSYALIADGIESTTDILSSLIVWGGLRIASKPPDRDHPYGHGKAEPLAGAVVALALFGAAIGIAIQSVREILVPHHAPAPFTLAVLVGVVVTKELLFRHVSGVGDEIESTAVRADAWHHRSDALTSAAAFVGISVALVFGKGYESADDWAALAACLVIAWNGSVILRQSLAEVMDAAPPPELERAVREAAAGVAGVVAIEKCRIRKSGLASFVDIHVEVNGDLPVRRGHEIAHGVKDALLGRADLKVIDVLVHIEPAGEAKGAEGP